MPHSLKKGQRGERDIIDRLQPILDHVWGTVKLMPPKLERRGLGLSGQDIVGLEWLAIEVKHREQLQVEAWWQQCLEQSQRRNGGRVTPVLVYKKNHVPWRVRMPGQCGDLSRFGCIVDIAFEDFEYWFYYSAMRELEAECDRRAK